jgi:hypothetical protein
MRATRVRSNLRRILGWVVRTPWVLPMLLIMVSCSVGSPTSSGMTNAPPSVPTTASTPPALADARRAPTRLLSIEDVTFVRYRGEGHTFERQWRRSIERTVAFFDGHLD